MADTDWDTDWDDDAWDSHDAEPADLSQPTTAPEPAQPPSYDVPDDMDDDDDGLLPPPPTDSFVSDRAASKASDKRSGTRSSRVRAAGNPISSTPEDTDDDEHDDTDNEPSSPSSDESPKKKGNGCGLMLLVLVVIGVVIAAGSVIAFRGTLTGLLGDESDSATEKPALSTAIPAPSPSAAPSSAAATTPNDAVEEEVKAKCVSSDSKTDVGNGAGNQKSGPGVIYAFDYAYYVKRSGVEARKFMSPDLKGTTVESLQKAIDELPQGTQHCLWISPKDGEKDVFSVKLAEYVPDGATVKEAVHEQVIHTAKDGDKYIIIGIVSP